MSSVKEVDEHLGVKPEDIPLVFDCKFLAKILCVSYSTARTIMHQPGFPVWRISEKKHRIYREPFLKWLDAQTKI